MTTQELIAAIRVRLADEAVPPLVSTATILEQLSLTQTEFARTTLVLFDTAVGNVVIGDPWLSVPDNMFLVKVVILAGQQLRVVTSSELDFGYYNFNNVENTTKFSNWREATGTPKFVVTDLYANKIRLVPSPSSNATVTIEGYIIPPKLFYDDSPTAFLPPVDPQIPEEYHEVLMAGALLRLYMLFDVEIFNPSKAQLYAAQWQRGLVEAQSTLQTALRRQMRLMELTRGFTFGPVLQLVEQKS